MARAVVVGAGPNGLSAAVELARAGWAVEVFEAADRVGGGTRTEELTLPGFRHDVCSAVHPMGAASPFFRRLPLADHGLAWVHPDSPLAHPFDDGTAALLERSTQATAATLDAGDGPAYRALMDPFVERWQDLFEDALAPPIHLPRHPLLLARLGLDGVRSARSLAEARFRGPRGRALFVGIAAHALEPPTIVPTAAFGMMLSIAGHAVGWPFARGGSQGIADALTSVLRAHGGRVTTGRLVDSLEEIPSADACLLDLTPRQVLGLRGTRLPGRYRARLARYRYGPGVFKIDWALSEPIPWAAAACRRAGTVHLGGSAEEIVRSSLAAWHGRRDERPLVLLSQPTLFDDTRAPAGRHIAWAYCHVPHASDADYTEAIERQVERFAPGFRDTILARSTRTAVELERHNPNLVGGDINGGAATLWQFVARPVPRANPYATPQERLYLCSASTPPGGAVHGMCGYYAARAVLRRRRS